MKTGNIFRISRILRLGLALLGGSMLAISAAHPPGLALAQGPRYVAPAPIGDDGNYNPCTNKNNPVLE